jgi:hypothetical protein
VIVGAALGGLILAASLLQVPAEDASQVVVMGDRVRRCYVGSVVTLNLRVDALAESKSQSRQLLRDVKLRIPLRVFENVRFMSMEPQPDEMGVQGSGRYFAYESLQRESELRLRLRVVGAGRFRIPMTIYCADHLPGDWSIALRALPKPDAAARTHPTRR